MASSEANAPQNVVQLRPVETVVQALRSSFDSGRTRSREWRETQLDALLRMLSEREQEIVEALTADVGKTQFDAYTAEVAQCASGVRDLRRNLRRWMKPERRWTTLIAQPGSSRVVHEPLGVVCVIAPWNYPFELALSPLAGAIAAGNCVLLKPSEVSARSSRLLARLIPEYLDSDCVKVVEGGIPETTEVLAQRFDHILYTGNGKVARIVMTAAAKHLTPVTLELGGKSPCIVAADCDLEVAARRIVWGKFYGTGQTCIAPDYVLAEEAIHDALLDKMKAVLVQFYGSEPRQSPDYGRVINERHHQRLMNLLEGAGDVVAGGEADEAERYIAPTILKNVDPDAAIMQEEIFGPLLPVLRTKSVDDAIAFVNARPKPLSVYLFTKSEQTKQAVVARTSSGNVGVNCSIYQFAVHGLPFGGVGESGMGSYHGKASFDAFSHKKGVLRKATWLDPWFAFPPYDDKKLAWIKRFL